MLYLCDAKGVCMHHIYQPITELGMLVPQTTLLHHIQVKLAIYLVANLTSYPMVKFRYIFCV